MISENDELLKDRTIKDYVMRGEFVIGCVDFDLGDLMPGKDFRYCKNCKYALGSQHCYEQRENRGRMIIFNDKCEEFLRNVSSG